MNEQIKSTMDTWKNTGRNLTFIMVNGYQLQCRILFFDDHSFYVEDKGHQKMLIMTHAISTIKEC